MAQTPNAFVENEANDPQNSANVQNHSTLKPSIKVQFRFIQERAIERYGLREYINIHQKKYTNEILEKMGHGKL